MNYFRFGGQSRFVPPILAIAQTNGSFYQYSRAGKANALLIKPDGTFSSHIEHLYKLVSVTEAEWASVYLGLNVAEKENQSSIALENNCLSVVHQIMMKSHQHHDFARYYYYKIKELSKNFDWCGIRWIPREMNRADKLLR
jgi:ribonuclease HI